MNTFDKRHLNRLLTVLATAGLACCSVINSSASEGSYSETSDGLVITGSDGQVLVGEALETFSSPWAMTFLPSGEALVTEKGGTLWLLDAQGRKMAEIANVPDVVARGQGGLGDVVLHPGFGKAGDGENVVFISYVERDSSDRSLSGAVVERAVLDRGQLALTDRRIIWTQLPKVSGNGHYSHRIAFSPAGELFIGSGERQKFTPAQDMDANLGKILRLDENGAALPSNPFFGDGAVTDQIWTLGHRNILGIDFDADGQLWAHEMGPKGGDELNRIVRSENYGYPEVSNGSHYSGRSIPDHSSNPDFTKPALSWNPSISPSGFVIYDGDRFDGWQGNGLMGGLSSRALIRVTLSSANDATSNAVKSSNGSDSGLAEEAARYSWGKRIREVEQSADGYLYVLEDGDGARLIRLQPR